MLIPNRHSTVRAGSETLNPDLKDKYYNGLIVAPYSLLQFELVSST